MRKFWLIFAIIVIAVVLYFVFRPHHAAPVPSTVGAGPGYFYHHGKVLLPNPSISPGLVRPGATEDEVCNTSTRPFRHTTAEMKREVYNAYDVIPHAGICAPTTHMSRSGKERVESCEV